MYGTFLCYDLDSNERPKPDPDGILKLAVLWDSSPEGLVMVGDYQLAEEFQGD